MYCETKVNDPFNITKWLDWIKKKSTSSWKGLSRFDLYERSSSFLSCSYILNAPPEFVMVCNGCVLWTLPSLWTLPPPSLKQAWDSEPHSTGRAPGCQCYKQRGSPKKERGYQDGQVSLSQKPVWLVLEREGAVTQNQRHDSVRL